MFFHHVSESPHFIPVFLPRIKKQSVPWAMSTPEGVTAFTLKTVYFWSAVTSDGFNNKQ